MKEKKGKSSEGDLKKELKSCQKEKEEFLTGWQRARADFLNYKKNESERIKEILKYANEDLIFKILPILDNFEKAEKQAPDSFKKDEYFKGIIQIGIQFKDFLKNQEIREIQSLGKKFDPNFHEVVEEIRAKDKEKGMVVEEVQKGYMFGDKLLRPAKVKIAK